MGSGPCARAVIRLAVVVPILALLITPLPGFSAAPTGQPQAAVDEIERQVSQIRGLPLSGSTPAVALPRPDLVQRLSKNLNTDHAIREFLTSQMLLEVLGAQPRGFDLRQLQIDLLNEQTIAVYDFDERTIFLVDDAAGGDLNADTRLVVAHESTHALQDQAFNLKQILPANPPNSDAASAARALVEGDAMLTMRIWGRQFLKPNEKRSLGADPATPDPVLDAAPPLVQGELLFPYDAGWVFAQLLYQDGGFDALNQAFARPPVSTEQILHPEKYAANEQPVAVTIPPLERWLGGSWVTRRTDVFGELVLRLLLEPSVGWPEAETAAQGWGGDAYTILEDASGRRVVGMVTVWDTEDDASQMYNAYVDSVPVVYSTGQPTLALPSLTRWSTPDYQIQVLTTGNAVRMVYAPDVPTLELADSALATTTIGPAGPVTPPSAMPTPSGPGPVASPMPAPAASPVAAPPAPVASPSAEPVSPESPSSTPPSDASPSDSSPADTAPADTAPAGPPSDSSSSGAPSNGALPAPAPPAPGVPAPVRGPTSPGIPERPSSQPSSGSSDQAGDDPPPVPASPVPLASPEPLVQTSGSASDSGD